MVRNVFVDAYIVKYGTKDTFEFAMKVLEKLAFNAKRCVIGDTTRLT
jgi:hypothetical protein